jgi:magnesium chelatase subunit I
MLAVNPKLAGVLIRGDKGTAKSTAARGLSALLPEVEFSQGCRFNCVSGHSDTWCEACREKSEHTFVQRRPVFATLPLGITEDQLLGSFDLEHALTAGKKRFEPGLLARVNHGVLYVDEVNLLDDHIVDLLLDAAVSGVNIVAREGVSISHQSQFMLVGTMNPEEGELRPQLQDRFGLCAEIRTLQSTEDRVEIVRRTLDFEADPTGFRHEWTEREEALRDAIQRARNLLPKINPDPRWYEAAANLSISLGVHGHRADILMLKASATLAALAGRETIESEDFEAAAPLVYAHRLKRKPFDTNEFSESDIAEQARETAVTIAPGKKKLERQSRTT